MRNSLRRLTLAALTLTGLGLLGDRPARAQNTYADFPYQQGSLFYRPSGARPPATTTPSNTGQRRFFRRQRGYQYAAPSYPPVAPGYGNTYAPRTVVPTTRDYYYPAR